jgi:hypothetical protein
MPGLVRVGGAWKTVSGISVRVGGAWKTVTGALVRVAGVWKSWGSPPSFVALVPQNVNSPEVYQFSGGFGAKFAAPATDAGALVNSVNFNPARNVLAASQGSSPYTHAWAWSATGFGSKFAAPGGATPGFGMDDVTWSPAGTTVLSAGTAGTNSLNAYNWSGGFGTRYANPSNFNTGVYGKIGWGPASNFVLIPGGNGFQYSAAYNFSSGWGTKLGEVYSFSSNTTAMQFNPAGNVVFTVSSSSPRLFAHSWSAGWGSKFADPASLPPDGISGMSMHPSGNAISATGWNATTSLKLVQAWAWSGGWGSKFADATLPGTSRTIDTEFSSDGLTVFVSDSVTPFVHAYPWLPGFGTKYANPASLPSGYRFGGYPGHTISA